MTHTCTEERFLRDVATHQMTVLHDDGLYRHIRFKRPDTGCMHFDLVTWPGYLAYSGDMGCYVFERLKDMFQFFRNDREDGSLSINPSYWTEKLQAVDGNRREAGAKEFSREKFERIVRERFLEWIRDRRSETTKEQRRELWDEIKHEVLRCDDNGYAAHNAAYEFSHDLGNGLRFEFTDFWEHDLTDYTFRMIWCLYAIAWGIERYDEAKARTDLSTDGQQP